MKYVRAGNLKFAGKSYIGIPFSRSIVVNRLRADAIQYSPKRLCQTRQLNT